MVYVHRERKAAADAPAKMGDCLQVLDELQCNLISVLLQTYILLSLVPKPFALSCISHQIAITQKHIQQITEARWLVTYVSFSL